MTKTSLLWHPKTDMIPKPPRFMSRTAQVGYAFLETMGSFQIRVNHRDLFLTGCFWVLFLGWKIPIRINMCVERNKRETEGEREWRGQRRRDAHLTDFHIWDFRVYKEHTFANTHACLYKDHPETTFGKLPSCQNEHQSVPLLW